MIPDFNSINMFDFIFWYFKWAVSLATISVIITTSVCVIIEHYFKYKNETSTEHPSKE